MDAATVGVLTGGIGVAGTLVGVVFTQWRSDVRERNRLAVEERREQQRLARDVERERDARLFDHRRTAYVAVIEQYHHWSAIGEEVLRGTRAKPPEDAMEDFLRVTSEVDLYGSAEAGKRALDLYFAVQRMVENEPKTADGAEDALVTAVDRYRDFVEAARADLGTTERWVLRGLEIDGVVIDPYRADE